MRKPLLPLLTLLACFAIAISLSTAQQLDHRQGEFIICLHSDVSAAAWIKKHQTFDQRNTRIAAPKCLSTHLNIWSISYDFTSIHEDRFLTHLKADPEVVVVQFNHLLKRRNKVPDDPLFDMQWHWLNNGSQGIEDADIDAVEAWNLTTGGISALGDTIVVALIDNGVDYMHPDLASNIWFNHLEVPGNGIDDDENGFIDDYRGWNVNLGNDNIEPELFAGGAMDTHGTGILGVMAANGNNKIGVAGINWNLKVMNVTLDLSLDEASMIESYAYILAQRKLYNETNGTKGAYVVATNLSYGEEDLGPIDAPIWCSFYDSLGTYGILNCAATANQALNIDSVQDLPTSCASDFLISVTASDDRDERTFAAFGKSDIDLAAPGELIFTTSIPDYGFETGTSYAAPMVAGVIAMLYSSPCQDLAALSKSDPAAAAFAARNYILESVDKFPALETELASGGRLNAFNAINETLLNCTTCLAPFDISISEEAGETSVSWNQSDSIAIVEVRYRLMGDTIWSMIDTATSPHQLGSLGNCNTYELELTAVCLDSTRTPAPTVIFSSAICCEATGNLQVVDRTNQSAMFSWDSIDGAIGYSLRYSSIDTIVWIEMSSTESTLEISGLTSCSDYLVQVQTECDSGLTEFTDTLYFLTMGCGPCLDSTYCPVLVEAGSQEYIDSFVINTLQKGSGTDDGYGDHTGGATTMLKQGSNYGLEIYPGFEGDVFPEHYWTWIDFNQDGNFDNESELIYRSDTAIMGPVTTVAEIPEDALIGITRLRVLMLFEPTQDTIFGCNTIIDFGEAEDYCVEIILDSLLCPQTPEIDTVSAGSESIDIMWTRVDSAIGYTIRYRKVGDDEWEEVSDTSIEYTVEGLEECNTYEIQIQSVCSVDTSGYTESFTIPTFCSTSNDVVTSRLKANLYPNPFHSHFTIDVEGMASGSGFVSLYQLQGKQLLHQPQAFIGTKQVIVINQLDHLPGGMYLAVIQSGPDRIVRKLLKQ